MKEGTSNATCGQGWNGRKWENSKVKKSGMDDIIKETDEKTVSSLFSER